MKKRQGYWLFVISLLCSGLLLSIGPAPLESSRASTSGPIKVLDYHGNILAVQTLLDDLALSNGWSVTHVTPTAFAGMTASQIQSYHVLFIVSGGAASVCGTNQWGGMTPDYSGLLANPNTSAALANGRKVITGLDLDWHSIHSPFGEGPTTARILTNAINWVGASSCTGYVALTDGMTCSLWWNQPGSFLRPLVTAPGVGLMYGDFGSAMVLDPTHPIVQGLSTTVSYCCHHTRIDGPAPGFTPLMIDPSGSSAMIVAESSTCTQSPLAAAIDIKPTSCPNPLNTGEPGVIPVAILGTAGFDVADVVPTSVRLVGIPPMRAALQDVASPFTGAKDNCLACTTSGADGFQDLTLKFDAHFIAAALGSVSEGECRLLKLTGNLRDGTAFEGTDVMIIRK
jgi:hypothetical protein